MTRDIQDRLEMFEADVYVKRVALTIEQINQFNPPPNPTKLTDSRATSYIEQFGHECWELDALEPQVISDLIEEEVLALVDCEISDRVESKESKDKQFLQKLCDNYYDVAVYVESLGK